MGDRKIYTFVANGTYNIKQTKYLCNIFIKPLNYINHKISKKIAYNLRNQRDNLNIYNIKPTINETKEIKDLLDLLRSFLILIILFIYIDIHSLDNSNKSHSFENIPHASNYSDPISITSSQHFIDILSTYSILRGLIHEAKWKESIYIIDLFLRLKDGHHKSFIYNDVENKEVIDSLISKIGDFVDDNEHISETTISRNLVSDMDLYESKKHFKFMVSAYARIGIRDYPEAVKSDHRYTKNNTILQDLSNVLNFFENGLYAFIFKPSNHFPKIIRYMNPKYTSHNQFHEMHTNKRKLMWYEPYGPDYDYMPFMNNPITEKVRDSDRTLILSASIDETLRDHPQSYIGNISDKSLTETYMKIEKGINIFLEKIRLTNPQYRELKIIRAKTYLGQYGHSVILLLMFLPCFPKSSDILQKSEFLQQLLSDLHDNGIVLAYETPQSSNNIRNENISKKNPAYIQENTRISSANNMKAIVEVYEDIETSIFVDADNDGFDDSDNEDFNQMIDMMSITDDVKNTDLSNEKQIKDIENIDIETDSKYIETFSPKEKEYNKIMPKIMIEESIKLDSPTTSTLITETETDNEHVPPGHISHMLNQMAISDKKSSSGSAYVSHIKKKYKKNISTKTGGSLFHSDEYNSEIVFQNTYLHALSFWLMPYDLIHKFEDMYGVAHSFNQAVYSRQIN